jgi:23S rRNA pseudouridine1911/1915/1917 synthase
LAAASTLTLLERAAAADLVEVAIATGRPHQIRIHCAALGAPLLGDPLYRPGGGADPAARPGDGGYALQAWRLELVLPSGMALTLTVSDPLQLGTPPPPRLPPTPRLPP